jgi:hypothetical protein
MSVKYTAKYTNTTSVTQTVYINRLQPKIQVLTRVLNTYQNPGLELGL